MWRSIAGHTRDYPTAEDIKEAKDREDKVTTEAQDALSTLKTDSLTVIRPNVITWRRLQEDTASSMEGRDLVEVIQSNAETWLGNLAKLLRHKDSLTVVQGVATPLSWKHCTQGATSMESHEFCGS